MNIPLPTIQPQVRTVCRMLRTKNAFASYGADDLESPWQTGDSSTAVFWCLKTMQTAGPDDGFAHPHTCIAGRSCYRADEE